jgi:hypothetical protein
MENEKPTGISAPKTETVSEEWRVHAYWSQKLFGPLSSNEGE